MRPPEEYEKTGKREDLLLLRCCSLTGRGLLPARRSHRSLCAGAAKRKNTGKVFVREPTACPSAQNRKKQRCNHGFKPKKNKTKRLKKHEFKAWVLYKFKNQKSLNCLLNSVHLWTEVQSFWKAALSFWKSKDLSSHSTSSPLCLFLFFTLQKGAWRIFPLVTHSSYQSNKKD